MTHVMTMKEILAIGLLLVASTFVIAPAQAVPAPPSCDPTETICHREEDCPPRHNSPPGERERCVCTTAAGRRLGCDRGYRGQFDCSRPGLRTKLWCAVPIWG